MKKNETNVMHTTINGRKITLVFANEPNLNLAHSIKSALMDSWVRGHDVSKL